MKVYSLTTNIHTHENTNYSLEVTEFAGTEEWIDKGVSPRVSSKDGQRNDTTKSPNSQHLFRFEEGLTTDIIQPLNPPPVVSTIEGNNTMEHPSNNNMPNV